MRTLPVILLVLLWGAAAVSSKLCEIVEFNTEEKCPSTCSSCEEVRYYCNVTETQLGGKCIGDCQDQMKDAGFKPELVDLYCAEEQGGFCWGSVGYDDDCGCGYQREWWKKTSRCKDCKPGYYGKNCYPCPKCTHGGICSEGIAGTGECVCPPGFTGSLCSECLPSYYGPSCLPCPPCISGTCFSGTSGSGMCICHTGWQGADCSECQKDHFGPNCQPCQQCHNGRCQDGLQGDGSCSCLLSWGSGDTPGGPCEQCAPGYFGSDCKTCPSCVHGVCDDGIEGNGTCVCDLGFTGMTCDACLAGTYLSLNGTSCAPCHKQCETCAGPTDSDCQSCASPFREVSEDQTSTGTGRCFCKEGYLEEGTTCKAIEATTGADLEEKGLSAGAIVAIAVVVSVLMFFLCGLWHYLGRLKRRRRTKEISEDGSELHTVTTILRLPRGYDDPNGGNTFTLLNTATPFSLPGYYRLQHDVDLKVGDELGAGGSGVVVAGTLLNKEVVGRLKFDAVAIKYFKDENLEEEVAKKAFLQEIMVTSTLSAVPHVVPFSGYCEEPRCIVTKRCQTDLSTLLHHSQGIRLGLPAILSISLDVAEAMLSVHHAGVIHRDLKASNILLDRVSSGWYPYICDFGIAKIVTDIVLFNQTFQDLKGLSPRYTAPEVFTRMQLASSPLVDPTLEKKIDVYSFGVILWELLTKRLPWSGCTTEAIAAAVLAGNRPEFPEESKADPCSLELQQLVTDCWAQNPYDRLAFDSIVKVLRQLVFKKKTG